MIYNAKDAGTLAALPEELKPYTAQVQKLIDSVFSDALLPEFENDRKKQTLEPNENFSKKEFQELWSKINRKAAYTVAFDSDELVRKCISTLNTELKITHLKYYIEHGILKDKVEHDELKSNKAFKLKENYSDVVKESVHSE